MTAPLRIAVLGYEFMGRAHTDAWQRVRAHFDVPPVELAVLVGRREGDVAAAADRLGFAEHATDWRAVLARDDIDLVDICTPGHLHAEMGIAALAAGKHVLMEKPLANSVAEAEELAAAAESADARGIRSLLGLTYRRIPALAHARDLISRGTIGTVRQVKVAYLQDWASDETAPMTWRLRRETAGSGALGDIASHAIDQVAWLTGQSVTEVSGRLHTGVTERPTEDGAGTAAVTVDDAAWAWLTLAGGAPASVEVSRLATGRKNQLTVEVYGSAGSLAFDLERLNELQLYASGDHAGEQGFRRILVTEAEHPYLAGWWPTGHVLGWDHAFVHQMRDLLLAIRDDEAPSPSFADGLVLQRVLAAVEASDADGSRRLRP